MKAYFVRHGESTLNAERKYQCNDTPLSELGRAQARLLANRLIQIPIGGILASPLSRAKETAEIINQKLQKPIRFTPLLIEAKRPSEISGEDKDNPVVKKIMDEIVQNFHKPNWRYSNEENFEDLRRRANNFLIFLRKQPQRDILVVSHGIIISVITATMIFGSKMKSHELEQWQQFVTTTHTGITLCEYTNKKRWKLIIWNDHSHFG